MSWAAHNVEAYEECEREAVTDLLVSDLKANGFESFDRDTLENIVFILQGDRREAFDKLIVPAKVGEAISSYQTKGFRYYIRGLYRRNNEGEFTKTLRPLTVEHKHELFPIVEQTAHTVLSGIRQKDGQTAAQSGGEVKL